MLTLPFTNHMQYFCTTTINHFSLKQIGIGWTATDETHRSKKAETKTKVKGGEVWAIKKNKQEKAIK
jgi:hypothetical protein